MNPQDHIAAASDFLNLADSSIAHQNRLLRSELLWCAAAHAVKAVAKRRGLRNSSHDDLFDVIGYLAGSLDVRTEVWFRHASRLHRNMYEGEMTDGDIARYRSSVYRLVRLLERLVS